MKEHPIIMAAESVRAIIDGRKTMTRRVMEPQPYVSDSNPPTFRDAERGDLFVCPDLLPTTERRGFVIAECEGPGQWHCMGQRQFADKHCPYGAPGDRLWVREKFCSPENGIVGYWADAECGAWMGDGGGGRVWMHHGVIMESPAYEQRFQNDQRWRTFGIGKYGGRWRSPVHMPRWASRLTLEVVSVRVERVQSISEADAIAEGVDVMFNTKMRAIGDPRALTVRQRAFGMVWDHFNAKRGYPWESNPWVWVIEFKRLQSNHGVTEGTEGAQREAVTA